MIQGRNRKVVELVDPAGNLCSLSVSGEIEEFLTSKIEAGWTIPAPAVAELVPQEQTPTVSHAAPPDGEQAATEDATADAAPPTVVQTPRRPRRSTTAG